MYWVTSINYRCLKTSHDKSNVQTNLGLRLKLQNEASNRTTCFGTQVALKARGPLVNFKYEIKMILNFMALYIMIWYIMTKVIQNIFYELKNMWFASGFKWYDFVYVLNGLPKFKVQTFINNNVINGRWQRSPTKRQKNCVKKCLKYINIFIYIGNKESIYMFQDFANNENWSR